MGESSQADRRMAPPVKCAECGWVEVLTSWEPDRRSPGSAPHLQGLCPSCRTGYILQGMALPSMKRFRKEAS